ncbi:hypothetical protein [Ruegeria atlantica]|uniref:hypothetical protein n=1 Tax=Ruegeria atlantica TaxID=81569 RepID=UPI001479EECE|nr:hypothetical protein [Ruegeria atlantica]
MERKGRAGCPPRRTRRGALLYTAALALMIGVSLFTLLMRADLQKTRDARNLARAQHVAELAALLDLHVQENHGHYSDELVRTSRGFVDVDSRLIAAKSLGALPADPNGFRAQLFVAPEPEGADPQGYILMRPLENPAYADADGLLDALEASGLVSGPKGGDLRGRLLLDEGPAATYLGRPLRAGEIILQTPALSGVTEEYVLRKPRVGHLAGGLSAHLDMNGHDVVGVGALFASSGSTNAAAGPARVTELAGRLDNVDGSLRTDAGTETQSLVTRGTLSAPELAVSNGSLTTLEVNTNVTAQHVRADEISSSALAADSIAVGDTLTSSGVTYGVEGEARSVTVTTMTADLFTAPRTRTNQLEVIRSCRGC